jgi:hypothetical protein
MVPGYDFWVWFTTRGMTNIICLKNLIRLYRVTYDSERQTPFIVHWEEFGLPNMIFDMHSCGLHVYHPKKSHWAIWFCSNCCREHEVVHQATHRGCVEGVSNCTKHLGTHQMPTLRLFSELMALAIIPLHLMVPR